MKPITATQLRARLGHHLRAVKDGRALRVTRKGKPAIAIVAAAEYDGLMEILHLSKSLKEAGRGEFVQGKRR